MPRGGGTSKGEILRSFAGLVARSGYSESSFREIAEELGISKGTIVHHYGTKDQLFAELHRAYMVRRLAEARELLGAVESPPLRLTALVAQLVQAQQDDRDATLSFAREVTRFSELETMRDVRAMRDEFSALLRDVVADGMASGDFRKGDADLVSLQVFGMCNWVWTWWRPGHAWSVSDVVESFMATILNGLSVADAPGKRDVKKVVALVEKTIASHAEDGTE